MNVYKYRSGSVIDIESLMNNQFFSASLESCTQLVEDFWNSVDYYIANN